MKTIVFIHGFMGGSCQWQSQVEALSDYNVVALDLPGFGKNTALPVLACIADFATWALDELTSQGIDKFILVGHSMGGMVVQQMVAHAPDRIEQLVLYSTGAIGIMPGRFETIEISKQRASEDGAQATARRISAMWFLYGKDSNGYEECANIAEQSGLPAIYGGLDAMQKWSGVEHLDAINVRTLVIWGDQDRTYPWRQIEQLWGSIKGSTLAVIPNASHAAHLEKPELFNDLLKDFLAG